MEEGLKPVILIIDDIPENIKIVGDGLREAGYSVGIASSGHQGILTAKNKRPDLILLDVQMPEINGFEVCKKLKEDQLTADIPVIFLTAKSGIDEVIKGFESGGVDYITKPFNNKELIVRVKTHLELKFAREKIEKLSFYDDITGVPNKRYFNKFFDIEWRRGLREQKKISVIFIDIDYFKDYNDTYGHLEGDKCLALVAGAISKCVERPGDFMARFGGEEFICILPHTNKQGALKVAEKIKKNIKNLKIEHKSSKIKPYLTVSIGISGMIPHFESEANTVILEADKALYAAKDKGRDRIEIFNNELTRI